MTRADIDKDPFLLLLTDALRAGPGSPEWRDAVAKLKDGGQDTDEYRLLIEARDALESGKDYRSVRAGTGFTRKLLDNIGQEQASKPRRPFPVAATLGVLAGIVILAAIAVAIYQFYPRGTINSANKKAIDDLASTYFPTQVLSTNFAQEIPPAWRTIGSLPVVATDGLHAGTAAVSPGAYLGGGIVTVEPLPADQAFSVQVNLQVKGSGPDLIPQVFVSSRPDFSSDRATSSQELVWQLTGTEQSAVVGGRVERLQPVASHTKSLTVRLIVNRDLAIVESDGHRLWAGANGLEAQPRYVGVRFIRTAGKAAAEISVTSVQIQKS
ncbi:MAG TPA: hypothetical protein VLJ39_03265 [Tepidisphaeraceae bacterium]|nr:hypothetical protein [Tepidisphaeraceae bacterium]